jgi:hypothetical protein
MEVPCCRVDCHCSRRWSTQRSPFRSERYGLDLGD